MIRYNNISLPVHDPPAKIWGVATLQPPGLTPLVDVEMRLTWAESERTVSSIIVLYCIVLYCIVWYCIVLYCTVLHCIALYCIVSIHPLFLAFLSPFFFLGLIALEGASDWFLLRVAPYINMRIE